jgi:hypothetical protein
VRGYELSTWAGLINLVCLVAVVKALSAAGPIDRLGAWIRTLLNDRRLHKSQGANYKPPPMEPFYAEAQRKSARRTPPWLLAYFVVCVGSIAAVYSLQ